MTFEIYKVLHLTGLVMIMLGLGGVLSAGRDQRPPRWTMILHGLGALALLGAGFGMLARHPEGNLSAPDSWEAWLILKIVVWFFLAALPALVRHGTVPRPAGWLIALLLAAAAAYLGILKPFR